MLSHLHNFIIKVEDAYFCVRLYNYLRCPRGCDINVIKQYTPAWSPVSSIKTLLEAKQKLILGDNQFYPT